MFSFISSSVETQELQAQLDDSRVLEIPLIPIEDEEDGGDDHTLGICAAFSFISVRALFRVIEQQNDCFEYLHCPSKSLFHIHDSKFGFSF
jgi:hypothetical protein